MEPSVNVDGLVAVTLVFADEDTRERWMRQAGLVDDDGSAHARRRLRAQLFYLINMKDE